MGRIESTMGADTYPADYKVFSGSVAATSIAEVPFFMNGPRTLLLDELTFRTDAGTGAVTATMYYAKDGADMDSTAGDNVRIGTNTVAISTAAKDAKKTMTLPGRVEIPPYATVWLKASSTITADRFTWVARGQER